LHYTYRDDINFLSDHLSVQFDSICFSTVVYCQHEHHNVNNKFLRGTFTSFGSKHFLAHMKLFKQFLSIFRTTKTGLEMKSRLMPWSMS